MGAGSRKGPNDDPNLVIIMADDLETVLMIPELRSWHGFASASVTASDRFQTQFIVRGNVS